MEGRKVKFVEKSGTRARTRAHAPTHKLAGQPSLLRDAPSRRPPARTSMPACRPGLLPAATLGRVLLLLVLCSLAEGCSEPLACTFDTTVDACVTSDGTAGTASAARQAAPSPFPAPQCGSVASPDTVFTFTSSVAATYLFTSLGTTYANVLYVAECVTGDPIQGGCDGSASAVISLPVNYTVYIVVAASSASTGGTGAITFSQTSAGPTASPTRLPSRAPVAAQPSYRPSKSPVFSPTLRPTTRLPSRAPASSSPSRSPSRRPSRSPSRRPSRSPSRSPIRKPSRAPSASPLTHPSRAPSPSPPTKAPVIWQPSSSSIAIGGTVGAFAGGFLLLGAVALAGHFGLWKSPAAPEPHPATTGSASPRI
jgi:hypothetical protein